MKIIREEKPGYLTLLFRKSSLVKIVETGAFIFMILILSATIGYEHPYFKLWAILSAIVALGLSPIIYKIFVNPVYTLTEVELIIKKSTKVIKISLFKITNAYDVRFIYRVDGKKMPFSVSNDFLEALETQLTKLQKKTAK